MNVEGFIDRSLSCEDNEQLLQCYQEAMLDFGYDRLVYTLVTDHPSIQKPAMHGVLFTYPEEWMRYYLGKGYERYDPVIRTAATATQPFVWDEMCKQTQLSKLQVKIMNEANEAGLKEGICIPLFGAQNEIAGVGLASSTGKAKLDRRQVSIMRSITCHFHAIFCENEKHESAIQPNLTIVLSQREREILSWVAEGKSASAIGQILNIDDETVKTYMKRIYKKLDTSEKTMAVIKALKLGLISPYAIRM